MILYQWQGATRNFGDELNTLLWPALLPDFFDTDPSVRFLGIGSVLDSRHGPDGTKLVAGAGYGGYEPPVRLDRSWVIHWVRGPRTARALGLEDERGLGDPASLIPMITPPAEGERDGIGFMPHFESLTRGHWRQAAEAAGLTLIDPRDDAHAILAAIGRCRVLISEAMHGVIVADALRVPWIAARPLAAEHRPKWFDWADSLDVRIVFHRLSASSLLEHALPVPLADRRPIRALLSRHGARLHEAGRERLVERAAQALRRIAAEPAQLSTDAALARCQDRMRHRIEAIRRSPLQESADVRMMARRPSLLRRGDEFAYHPASTG